MIKPCPHCGVADEVYVNIRAFGWAQEYFGLDGMSESMQIDQVQYTNSDTLRCASCQKVRRDLEIVLDSNSTRVQQRQSP